MVEADISQGDFDPDMRATLNSIVEELIDEVSLGVCFEVHRSCKVGGSVFLNGFDDSPDTDFAIIDRPGVDVLGQVQTKKNYECVCPNCQRNLAASRFAPHLEKCMGMGRNSSRIASRRIANNQKHGGSDESGQEDENDDWNYAPESKRLKRLKRNKTTNSPRNKKMAKLRNGRSNNHNNTSSSSSQPTTSSSSSAALPVTETPPPSSRDLRDIAGADNSPNYENMTLEERKALLLSSCGVISEHTKKMCTRTGKCAQHTDEQRRQVRQQLLRQSRGHDLEDLHIDIDTYDDVETQSLRESLQWEASSNSSPADSTSTNNSTCGVPPVAPGTTTTATSNNNNNSSGSTSGKPALTGSSKTSSSSGKSGKTKKQKGGSKPPSTSSSSSTSSSTTKEQPHSILPNLFDL